MIKSDVLGLFHIGNECYQSPKISLEAIQKMCASCNSDYFQIRMMKSKYKEGVEKRPDYVFYIISDTPKKGRK